MEPIYQKYMISFVLLLVQFKKVLYSGKLYYWKAFFLYENRRVSAFGSE